MYEYIMSLFLHVFPSSSLTQPPSLPLSPQTSGYTLTVVASDNGSPARSSVAAVNVDVSDVNDNPPLFAQANYSLIIQVWGSAGERASTLEVLVVVLVVGGIEVEVI
jgi:hypothetical protein